MPSQTMRGLYGEWRRYDGESMMPCVACGASRRPIFRHDLSSALACTVERLRPDLLHRRHLLAKCEVRGGLLGSRAVGLTLLRTVDAAEADTLRMIVVQHFNGVAIHDSDHFALILGDSKSKRGNQESNKQN